MIAHSSILLPDIIVEDSLILPAYDIQYEVGRNHADDHKVWVEVGDERLDVHLVPRAGSRAPVINTLRVVHRPDRLSEPRRTSGCPC